MTDEQAWTDIERFAAVLVRFAPVVFNNSDMRPGKLCNGKGFDLECMIQVGGIREIIEPPQKKVRPLNAEEWRDVMGCIRTDILRAVEGYSAGNADYFAANKVTCHPPGNSNDVRKLWVEE